MEVKAKDRQSLLDMAVQTAGSVEAAFRLSAANDIGITDTLEDGQVLSIPYPLRMPRRYAVTVYRR